MRAQELHGRALIARCSTAALSSLGRSGRIARAISARPWSSCARMRPGASAASFSATKVASLGLSAARYASVARIAAST